MSTNEKDYSNYIQHMSNLVGGMLFMTGILLTVITLLLTQIPDPSTLPTQVALFFLMILFSLTGFMGIYLTIDVIHYCKEIPPYQSRIRMLNLLSFLASGLWGLSVAILFFLWNLTYLALASLAVWALSLIAMYLTIWKPFQKWRK